MSESGSLGSGPIALDLAISGASLCAMNNSVMTKSRRRRPGLWLAVMCLASQSGIAAAAPIDAGGSAASFGRTGEPLPRFVSLGAAEVNLRVGPGRGYPVEWTYNRRGLPVEIVEEYGDWRRIKDPDGTQGWVLKELLSATRNAIVTGDQVRTLFAQPKPNAKAVWRVEPGVMLQVLSCADAWCEVAADTRKKAWILRTHLWGVYGDENFP